MVKIENSKVKETVYVEKLENGITLLCIPKPKTIKKYVIWGIHYGSNDNQFIVPGQEKITEVPNGVAHFLEHKMFEQENGKNSLDVLTALGVNANAYTTNDHTAYLFECTDNFYPALDELMDYVQHPYFTDENVEKEKGIIGQEISMYDDYPEWKVYLNAVQAMYQKHPIRIDITGTKQTISKITKETLYNCYNTFYHPSNTCLVVVGDFQAEEIFEQIKERLLPRENQGEIKRIKQEEPEAVAQKETIQKMEVSIPLFVLGYKDKPQEEEMVKKHIAIEILLGMIIGKSSKLYQRLYEEDLLKQEPDLDYEFSKEYAHVMITGKSNNPKKVQEAIEKQIEEFLQNGLDENDFQRIKKKIYGDYVKEYNDVADIARMFLADFFKGINSFDYLEKYAQVTREYTQQVLKEVFQKEKEVISIVEGK